ncbi:hypothetical protein Peur_034439 [Populus x canadensis]
MPRFGGYVGNWFNGYVGVGRAMAELRWAAGFFFLEGDENCQGRWVAVASMERSRTWESKHWKPCLWMMNFELCCFGFLVRSVLFPVGKGGEQGADFQEPRVYLTEIADLLIMAWTILDRNSRPCLQAILGSFFFPTEKIADKICGCCCTGASIPFLSEIHVERLYNQTQNALFSFSITAKIKFCFVSGKLKLLEDCTATPGRDCGCSRGLQQLFDSYCYGDGSNHLIFVTRIKEVYFGSRQPFGFSV